ncbi:hypothetical protein LGQ02_05405 [Bacillus shivajii]|uniref:hypothetical protein n=1 Tax=Bacillus shivajii TaxID=1983719 RepID=UPI001CFB4697|nr:hypothetical protein [Bacillus shivajii]UCZ54198.1 hypothetical protein LGQ02_05405 [Bacillus shivajii]
MMLVINRTKSPTSKSTVQDLINQMMKQIMIESKTIEKKNLLDTIYRECHPCVSSLFSTSGDFLLRMSAIIDYILQILTRLRAFDLKQIIEYRGTYIFFGKNNQDLTEVWVFLSAETKEDQLFKHGIKDIISENSSSNFSSPWVCFLYCLDDGELKDFFLLSPS